MNKKANTHGIILVQFQHGVYNSSAPASFLQAGKTLSTISQTYTPCQYMSLVIASEIMAGATGVVHNPMLEVLTASAGIWGLHVMVKFAFEHPQQQKLCHEFSVYEHLALSRIDGIPTVFALFEDTESDTVVLVMTHTGICLLDCGPDALKVTILDPNTVLEPKTVSNLKSVLDSKTALDSDITVSNIRLVMSFMQDQVN